MLYEGQIKELAADRPEKDRLAAGLNKVGAEGWELVAVMPPNSVLPTFVFKRPVGPTPRGRLAASAGPAQAPAAAPVAGAVELRVFRLKNARAVDMERMLSKLFQAGARAGGGVRLASDERTNSVLAHGTPTQLDEIEAILTRLDTPDGAKAPAKK